MIENKWKVVVRRPDGMITMVFYVPDDRLFMVLEDLAKGESKVSVRRYR